MLWPPRKLTEGVLQNPDHEIHMATCGNTDTKMQAIRKILQEEKGRCCSKQCLCGHCIGNAYALAALGNPDRHEALDPKGRSGAIYREFKEFVTKFDLKIYNASAPAQPFNKELEDVSRLGSPAARQRNGTRTTISRLVGRLMLLVQARRRTNQEYRKELLATEQAKLRQVAWNKQSLKRDAIKAKMGTAKFNAKKHREQAASRANKAAKLSENEKRVAKFTKYRSTLAGREVDRAYVSALHTMVLGATRGFFCKSPTTRHLGYTDCGGFAAILERNIETFRDVTIKFRPDAGNIRTQLFQYVKVLNAGVLRLSSTNDLDSNKEYKITQYVWKDSKHKAPGELYVGLDQKTISFYRSLPKEWADFTDWRGFGIVGNPKKTCTGPMLVRICPYNICELSFRICREPEIIYKVGCTAYNPKTATTVMSGIKDKYQTAVAAAEILAEEKKRARAQASRAAAMAKNTAKDRRLSGKFPVTKDMRAHLKTILTQQLLNKEIDQETFKLGMEALD